MKNTILNPAPLPPSVSGNPKIGGKASGLHSQHSQSQAGSIIFPSGLPGNQVPAYKSSI